jgi:starvation-inducible DNA-binding protein
MAKNAMKAVAKKKNLDVAQPNYKVSPNEIQPFGTLKDLPLALENNARQQSVVALNQILADTITLRDLYKKHHWQVSGATFYALHLLLDKHYEAQAALVDSIAERIMTLGGISIAMAHDVAELTRIARPPKGREDVPTQISRLLEAHKLILGYAREAADAASDMGDEGTNDLLISNVVRTGELQVWFLAEHLAATPLLAGDR